MRTNLSRAATSLALLAATAALTACGSSSSPAGSGSTGGSTGAAHGKVTLSFVNWDGGMQSAVDQWNKENPDIQVQLTKPSGTGYTLYNKLITNNAAGTNPDVTEVEYQALPALIANKVVVPIDQYIGDISAGFDKSSLAQVQFEGKTYGVPQNVCPMVFFYRKDIFDSLGLKAPTTWDEYAADAATIHAKNPKQYIGNFSAVDSGWFAGLAQQAGANWWTTTGTTWNVAINDAPTQKVANYWSGLIDKGLVSPEPNWSPQWNTDMNSGNDHRLGQRAVGAEPVPVDRQGHRRQVGRRAAAGLDRRGPDRGHLGRRDRGGDLELQAPGRGREVREVAQLLRRGRQDADPAGGRLPGLAGRPEPGRAEDPAAVHVRPARTTTR